MLFQNDLESLAVPLGVILYASDSVLYIIYESVGSLT
jgi:hypothetical protein